MFYKTNFVSWPFLESCNFLKVDIIGVPHSKSGIVPRSSLLGAGQLGFREVGKAGTIG
jgi:hypothetical protein